MHVRGGDGDGEIPATGTGTPGGCCSTDNGNSTDAGVQRPDAGVGGEDTWAQCERCDKWRKLKLTATPLAEQWFCELNPDAAFASCDAPEEEYTDSDEEGEEGGEEEEEEETPAPAADAADDEPPLVSEKDGVRLHLKPSSKSGYKGVYRSSGHVWHAQVWVEGKAKHIGSATASSKLPSWWGHSWPPRALLMGPEGLRLLQHAQKGRPGGITAGRPYGFL